MNNIDTNATAGIENAGTSMTDTSDVDLEQQHENTTETTSTTTAVNELDAAFNDSRAQASKSIKLEAHSEAARRKALAGLAFILVKDEPDLEFVDEIIIKDGLDEKYRSRKSAAIVRIAFGFKTVKAKNDKDRNENQRISNTVNRYANVIDSCVDHFRSEKITVAIGDIEVHIADCGIDALAKGQSKPVEKSEPDIEDIVKDINPMAEFVLPERLKNRSAPFALVVVPSKDGKGKIVLVQSGDDNLMRRLVAHGQGHDLSNVAPEVNLLSEVSMVSRFILEKDSVTPNTPGSDVESTTTKFLPETRIIMLRNTDQNYQFHVSNMRVKAGPVLHASPRVPFTVEATGDFVIDTKDRKWFEEEVVPENKRGRFNIEASVAEETKKWAYEFKFTEALTKKDRLIKLRSMPVEKIDPISVTTTTDDWNFKFPVDTQQFRNLKSEFFDKWSKMRKSKTSAITLEMTFADTGWTIGYDRNNRIEFDIETGMKPSTSVSMLALGQHWNDLFRQMELLDLDGNITISGLKSGLWRIAFQTKLAAYTVFLPDVLDAKSGTLNPKHFDLYSTTRK